MKDKIIKMYEKYLKIMLNKGWKIAIWIISILLILGMILFINSKAFRDFDKVVTYLEKEGYECTEEKSGNPFYNDSYTCTLEEGKGVKTYTLTEGDSRYIYVTLSVEEGPDKFIFNYFDTVRDGRVYAYSEDADYEEICMYENISASEFKTYYKKPEFVCEMKTERVIMYYQEYLELYKEANIEDYLE